jgi:cell division protein FtsQ
VDRVSGARRRKIAATAVRAGPVIAAAAACAALALLAWRHGVGGDLLRVGEIRFEGLSRATPEELLEISPVQRGEPFLFCDTELVEAALRRHPWIASVEVRRRLPPALEVRVVERTPAAIVDLAGLYLVDTRGEVFKRAVPGDGLDLPVITGIARDDWIERRQEVEPLLSAALALLDRWAERGLDRRAAVSEIHIDAEYGTTLWMGTEGVEVRLGQGDLPQKLERLDRVLSALDADGRRAEVLHLDNRRRPDWVAVRLAGRRGQADSRSAAAGRGDSGGSSPR